MCSESSDVVSTSNAVRANLPLHLYVVIRKRMFGCALNRSLVLQNEIILDASVSDLVFPEVYIYRVCHFDRNLIKLQ